MALYASHYDMGQFITDYDFHNRFSLPGMEVTSVIIVTMTNVPQENLIDPADRYDQQTNIGDWKCGARVSMETKKL
jgi:ABC-type sulfate transport system permease subunit